MGKPVSLGVDDIGLEAKAPSAEQPKTYAQIIAQSLLEGTNLRPISSEPDVFKVLSAWPLLGQGTRAEILQRVDRDLFAQAAGIAVVYESSNQGDEVRRSAVSGGNC